MVDVGNREVWGQYTVMNLTTEDTPQFMDAWLNNIKASCEQNNLAVTTRMDNFKLPNMAREMGGAISVVGGFLSSSVVGYTIEDATNGSSKNAYYRIHLIPQYEHPATVINIYCETWYNILFGNKKVVGQALFDTAVEIVRNTFNEL